jgi:hypothetical protein
MKRWRYVQAYSRGTAHILNDLPCQDRVLSQIIIDADGQEIFLGTVADGAGSACRSEYGAQIATRLILKKFEEEFCKQGRVLTQLSRTNFEQWITEISDQIGELANDEGLNRREYACTLLFVAVKPKEGLFFQVGDGAIVIGSEEKYDTVFWPLTGEYANSTYFITDTSAIKHIQFRVINKTIDDIALMSDGLQALALQFATKTAHTPFFKPMFTRLAEESNPGCSKILSASLKRFLDSELICNRTDDDKTLILSTCRCNPFSQAVAEEVLESNEAL